jgi:transcriptional regulator with XRE-family HTH domain
MEKEKLGKAIRLARSAIDISQDELARTLSQKQQAIALWEQTGRVPKKHWQKIKEVLGVDPEDYRQAEAKADACFASRLSDTLVLSALEQSLIEEIRVKDLDGTLIRKFLRELSKVDR